MAIRHKEYLLTTNKFKVPEVLTKKKAVGMLLLRLMIMDPGTDPLHPDMGVGIRRYRYTVDQAEALRKKIEDQINTYLPYFSDTTISLIYCPDHTVNVEVTLNGDTYVYDSATAPVPIILEDIAKG